MGDSNTTINQDTSTEEYPEYGLYLDSNTSVILVLTLTILGFMMVCFMMGYSGRKLRQKASVELSRFHLLLFVANCLFGIGYIPYIYSTVRIYITKKNGTYDSNVEYADPSPWTLLSYSVSQTAGSVGLFVYVLMVQLRYRIVRNLDYYSKMWDILLMGGSLIVFTTYIVSSNVLYWTCYTSRSNSIKPACITAASMTDHLYLLQFLYLSIVDSILGMLLILKIVSKCKSKVNRFKDTTALKKVSKRVNLFLVFWLSSMWTSFALACLGMFADFPVRDEQSKFNFRYVMNDFAYFLTIIQVALSIKYFDVLTLLTRIAVGRSLSIEKKQEASPHSRIQYKEKIQSTTISGSNGLLRSHSLRVATLKHPNYQKRIFCNSGHLAAAATYKGDKTNTGSSDIDSIQYEVSDEMREVMGSTWIELCESSRTDDISTIS